MSVVIGVPTVARMVAWGYVRLDGATTEGAILAPVPPLQPSANPMKAATTREIRVLKWSLYLRTIVIYIYDYLVCSRLQDLSSVLYARRRLRVEFCLRGLDLNDRVWRGTFLRRNVCMEREKVRVGTGRWPRGVGDAFLLDKQVHAERTASALYSRVVRPSPGANTGTGVSSACSFSALIT